MLPRLPGLKSAIFCRRLLAFHQTFAPLGKRGKPVRVIWHEGDRGRDAKDVASGFIKFMRDVEQHDKDHFTIWADNCSAQNKNWWLFTALIAEVNRPEGPNSITIKYFEPGHTFMSCDSFHHQVELKMKKQKRVEDFEDFKSVIGDRGVAIEMKIEDIFQYTRGVSTGKFASGKPKIDDIQVVMFAKGTKHIYWKKCFADESFSSAAFLQKKVASFIDKHQNFESNCSNRGMQSIKKLNIIEKPCPYMLPSRRVFWENIIENDVSEDLSTTRGYDDIDIQSDK